MKCIVLRGKTYPGIIDCRFVASDVVIFDCVNSKDLEIQKKEWAIDKFQELGGIKMDIINEITFFRKNVPLDSGILSKGCSTYEYNDVFLIFLPISDIETWSNDEYDDVLEGDKILDQMGR